MKHTFTKIMMAVSLVVFNMDTIAQTPQTTNIDINNIDAMITSSGDLFWDFNSQGFEVPKGSGKHAIFNGNLWIGGYDADTLLHMSCGTYSQAGYDYRPGPIDTINGVPAPISTWNKSWKLNKQDVLDHQANYTNVNYIVPQNIAGWPGYNASLGRVLAPFADYNGNGIYDPANGDYPYILGDQTVYSIFNDLTIHSETNCDTIGIEVHRTFWGFDAPSNTALNNSIFSRYEIKNFSNKDYVDVYIALWTDFDLGNAMDDYVGTDIGLNMVYCYNGDPDDETASGYGLNPPAVGVYFLNTPLYGSLVYDNVNGVPNGNPAGCIDYYNYIRSFWLDNQPLTYGENGRNPANPMTSYMYPGITNPAMNPTYGPWDEMIVANPPGDRRALGAMGPITIPAYGYFTFDAGYTWSRATSGGPLASVAELQADVSSLRIMYDNGQLTALKEQNAVEASLSVYPNPARDVVSVGTMNEMKNYTIRLYDITGRIVYENTGLNDSPYKIDVAQLKRGMYLVEVFNQSAIGRSKVILE